MLATVHSVALSGIEGHIVKVEVDVATGLPGWEIVGAIIQLSCASFGSSRSGTLSPR